MAICFWLKPNTRNMAQSSKCLNANDRAANATATALSKAANKATRFKNLPARSKVWRISGRPVDKDSTRTPRTCGNLTCSCAQVTKRSTVSGSPTTAKRQVMRLAGCTKPVASKSARCIITRGAKFIKPAPRSGSCNNTPLTDKRLSPSHRFPPTCKPNAFNALASAQTSPGWGIFGDLLFLFVEVAASCATGALVSCAAFADSALSVPTEVAYLSCPRRG